jgi:hypothetical protein
LKRSKNTRQSFTKQFKARLNLDIYLKSGVAATPFGAAVNRQPLGIT